jgi:transposase InsO family protein
VSDITYVSTLEGWLYLAVILDLFSRKVIGWKLGETLQAELGVAALKNALMLRQPDPGLYFHSDQGSQYGSDAVTRGSPAPACSAIAVDSKQWRIRWRDRFRSSGTRPEPSHAHPRGIRFRRSSSSAG